MGDLAGVETRCERDGWFLGYRGRELPLPHRWQSWNAYRGDELVGSLTVSLGPADAFDWHEADYQGPFFAPGPRVAMLGGPEPVAVLQCVFIHPLLRGGGLWHHYATVLRTLDRPVYAAFANERLAQRFRSRYPAPGRGEPR
jgi:hypothetical protein